ncbi:MAG: DUF6163 family protein [Rhizobiaceae bacterium]|nr:DUF6163 family protein [Rhizobiaceae bacterium]
MVSTTKPANRSGHDLWLFGYHAFVRLIALFYIVFTIQVWMHAIGLMGQSGMGFDTMPVHWRWIIATQCVLHPLTALGLWGLFSWGIAVWLINVAIQMVMYLLFSDLFGFEQTLVIFHVVTFVMFVIFQIALRVTDNKA